MKIGDIESYVHGIFILVIEKNVKCRPNSMVPDGKGIPLQKNH